MIGQTPSVDDLLGKPSPDDILGPDIQGDSSGMVWRGEDMDQHFSQGAAGHVADLFGQGFREGWGARPLGMAEPATPEEKAARDAQLPLIKQFNEQLVRPAVKLLDAALRAPYAVARGLAEEPGPVGVAGGIASGLMEAFPVGHATGFPKGAPGLPELARARELGIIGQGEAGWKGTPEADIAARQALSPTGTERPTERVIAPPEAPPEPADIHGVARQVAPETFADYDRLAAQKDSLRQQMDTLAEARRASPEATRLQDQMDAIMARVGGRESDLTTAAMRRYNTAYFALEDLLGADTPEMAGLRQQLMRADEGMRDLAPQVSAAYREAQARMPAPEPPPAPEIPVEAATAPEAPPPAEVAPAAEPAAPASPQQASLALPARPTPEIAEDVSRQLVAAGRSREEADAAAAIVAAHYEARARRFEGALGSAAELYQAEGARIRGRAQGGPGGIAAGRSTLTQARTIITLFQRADASTFLHETGHQWLGELLRDAADPRAPDELKTDAETVRQWLGAGAGEPTRAQHEQFARGFEAYMMEGRAPSQALAGVFAKFRDWLMAIYDRVKAEKLPVIDSVRGVFDRLIGEGERPPEQPVIAPDRALPPAEPAPPALPEMTPAQMAAFDRAAEARLAPPDAPTMRRRPETAYVAVPPEPQRLADFLKRAGGLKEEGGELRAIEAGRRPGLVNRSGLELDYAREAAEEAGYLEPNSTIADLLNALDEDLRGMPRYAKEDADAVAAFNEAAAKNSEVDRIAHELGIDPRDWTKDQFWNMAAEHLAGEQAEAEMRAIDEARQAEFDDAEKQAREWADSRGDAWEPEAHVGRTMEELEREIQQERSGGAARPGAGGAEGAGPAAGDQGSLQGERRQGGSDAGAGRRAEAPGEPTEPPASAAGRFRADQRYVDKAGNIRLDNLNQPDDIDQAIRDAAARNGDFLPERRNTLSDGEVLDLAEALGKDPAFLDRKKIGQAFNAEEVLAARHLLIRSATAVRDLMVKAAGGAPEDVLELAQAIAKHEMIQGKVAQATAEWGRAGRSFRMLMEGAPEAEQLDQFLRENAGRTLYQIQEMAARGQSLQTPAQVSRLIADTAGGRIRRAIIYYWINALISGPITHARYSVGNAINALWSPLVETPIAAAVGAAREALDLGNPADRVYLGEAAAQLYGLAKGTRDGWNAATEAFRTGISPPLPGERIPAQFLDQQQTPPIPGVIGTALGVPGRSVAAIHSFFKSLRFEQNIQALAYRTATSEGLEGEAFTARVTELTSSPTEAMMGNATSNALKELYMTPTDYHSLSGALIRATNHPSNLGLLAKIIVPFLKIGSQITRNAFIERTPLGAFSTEVRGNLLSGTAAGDIQAGKITAGVGLAAASVLMAAEGLLTGDGPADPAQKAVWLLNHRPNTITIGDITVPFQGLGHLGMLMRFSANMYQTAHAWNEEDGGKIAASFLEGATKSVLDENFMRGLKDVLDAVYHPIEYGPSFLRNFVANWLPYSIGLGQVARVVDPVSRQQRSVGEAVMARLPFVSPTLEPRRDRFGEPIRSTTGLPQFTEGRYADDRTVKAMEELHLGIGQLSRKIRGVELTEPQYDDYARISGRFAKQRLDLITAMPGFAALRPEMRIDLMHKAISQSREAAASLLMMQNPEIIKAALAAKTAKLGVTQ